VEEEIKFIEIVALIHGGHHPDVLPEVPGEDTDPKAWNRYAFSMRD
jgi:hypothetical protein